MLICDLTTETMSDVDEDKLAENINEFDRLMAEHEALQSTGETQDFVNEFDRLMAEHEAVQSTGETQDFVVTDDVSYTVGAAKPDVDIDDAEHGGIELVQLPVADDKEKSKQPTDW